MVARSTELMPWTSGSEYGHSTAGQVWAAWEMDSFGVETMKKNRAMMRRIGMRTHYSSA